MRLTGAMNARLFEHDRSLAVLEEIVHGEYPGSIGVDARTALHEMYKRPQTNAGDDADVDRNESMH